MNFSFSPVYLFPLAVFLVIAALMAMLPDVLGCDLSSRRQRRVTLTELCFLLLLCTAYTFIAFLDLGDTDAPEEFTVLRPGESVIVELPGDEPVWKVAYYAGNSVGTFRFELSSDGISYVDAGEFSVDYASVLRWDSFVPDMAAQSVPPRFVRISGVKGAPRLGELGFFNRDDRLIVPLSGGILTDEQTLVPLRSSYMNGSYFDEVYHVRTAQEHRESMPPYEISHPPLGKLIIALGISLFGFTPFGWRFPGTLCGVLMLPALYFFSRRLFDRRVALCCTAIFAFDFLHFTQTRIATIDSFAVFFVILMYWFMYLYISTDGDGEEKPLLYLALSGVFFGLGAASKWTCIYAGGGLAVIWLAHWIIKAKNATADVRSFFKNCLFCTVFFVLIPAVIYYLSYFAYGKALGLHGFGMFFNRRYLDVVLENQRSMFSYHSGLVGTHPYSSRWYEWVLDIRPILYYLDKYGGTEEVIVAIVNPALCWGGLIAMVMLGGIAVLRRERRAAFIVAGYLAQLVPWMFVSRLTFEYHYFASTVFLVLALGYVFDTIQRHERVWRLPVYGFTVLCVGLFVLFYPVLSGAAADSALCHRLLCWLPTWPL